ncbi:hypothetical protein [Streptomyces sp. NPDC096033]|uniref:hypothetical protein n=1 Tax=Streptomyces sp. NPDC096033 TaxID=3366071 RepID=UPI003806D1ED
MNSENPRARQWPGHHSKPSYAPGQNLVFPAPVPADLRVLGEGVRAAAWPVRPAFRPSRIALLDTLCHWQTLRALAYVQALAAGAADAGLLRDLGVVPGQEAAGDPALPELLARLEGYAVALPPDLVDAVVSDCGGLLADNRFAASVLAAGLAADSGPADTDEAVSRAVVLTSYWYETPDQRGALALAWSANLFVRSWLWWSVPLHVRQPGGRDRHHHRPAPAPPGIVRPPRLGRRPAGAGGSTRSRHRWEREPCQPGMRNTPFRAER